MTSTDDALTGRLITIHNLALAADMLLVHLDSPRGRCAIAGVIETLVSETRKAAAAWPPIGDIIPDKQKGEAPH